MNKKRERHIFHIVFSIVTLLGLIACPGQEIGKPARGGEEFVPDSAYPLNFSGTLTATENNSNVACSRSGTANLVIGKDKACVLGASFPLTIVDQEGKCVENGETKAWYLYGKVSSEQECIFTGCNYNSDYYASGKIAFDAQGTNAAPLSCFLTKTKADVVHLSVGGLVPIH